MSTNKMNKPKKREVLVGVLISVEQARNVVAVYLTIKKKYYLFYIESNVYSSLCSKCLSICFTAEPHKS